MANEEKRKAGEKKTDFTVDGKSMSDYIKSRFDPNDYNTQKPGMGLSPSQRSEMAMDVAIFSAGGGKPTNAENRHHNIHDEKLLSPLLDKGMSLGAIRDVAGKEGIQNFEDKDEQDTIYERFKAESQSGIANKEANDLLKSKLKNFEMRIKGLEEDDSQTDASVKPNATVAVSEGMQRSNETMEKYRLDLRGPSNSPFATGNSGDSKYRMPIGTSPMDTREAELGAEPGQDVSGGDFAVDTVGTSPIDETNIEVGGFGFPEDKGSDFLDKYKVNLKGGMRDVGIETRGPKSILNKGIA